MSEFFKGTADEAADRINWLESSIAEWRSVALAYSREAEAARATASLLLDQVAALKAEREVMLQDGWRQCALGQRTTQFCAMTEEAVKAEREACAALFDDHKVWDEEAAAIIRERGDV